MLFGLGSFELQLWVCALAYQCGLPDPFCLGDHILISCEILQVQKPILSIKFTATQNFQIPTVFTNLPICRTTWNDLKWLEATWNDLQRARNDLKWPTVIKKWTETTYKQEATWNNLQRTHSNFMEPLYLKNNRLEDS